MQLYAVLHVYNSLHINHILGERPNFENVSILEQCDIASYIISKGGQSLGVSIIGGKDSSSSHSGIFVKNIFKDGAAFKVMRLSKSLFIGCP